ncbi:hypothetical protein [Lysobacter firmicutimachus]|uniref:Uncharacterized protein n=1 Tax=Lysobacter firmicutimachus TaxID=1792846 RepID=A0ABU8D2U9_9GAMM
MRQALLIFLALLSVLAAPAAFATTGTCSKSYSLSVDDGCANEGDAAAAAFAAARGRVDAGNPSYPDWVVCGLTNDPPPSAVAVKICLSPTNSTGVAAYTRYYNNTCSSLGERLSNSVAINGTMRCDAGCEHRFFNDGKNPPKKVATGRSCDVWDYKCPPGYVPGGGVASSLMSVNCLPDGPPECPTGTRLEEGKCVPDQQCPNGQHMDSQGKCTPNKEECPAGQTKGPDGSCVDDGKCPAGQVRGQDGSCKKDGDGDGDPDPGEDDGKFSGGDDCKNPPQCSGDNILCGQARIQWRIDCNTRRNENITGGACNAMPVCTGEKCNAMEYASLLQTWRMRCALERMEANAGGTVGGAGQQPDWTKVPGMSQDPGAGGAPGDTNIWAPSQRLDGSGLNASGFVGGGGTCPGFGVTSGGSALTGGFMSELASPPASWCTLISWAGIVFNVFALVTAIFILARP